MISFITYNISKSSQIFKDLVDYVMTKDDRIVAVQEVLVSDQAFKSDKVQVFPNSQKGSQLCFLVSNNLRITNQGAIHKKIQAISLPNISGEETWIVNVHGYSRSRNENSNQVKGGIFNLLSRTYYSYPNRIVCGDFNAHPFDSLIACKADSSLFARRDIVDLQKNPNAMYNPAWRFLKERKSSKGTHLFDDLSSIICWEMFDQIIVSKNYSQKIKTLTIPNKLGKIDTRAALSHVSGKGHLPLLCTIDL